MNENSSYEFQKPENTYLLEDYIACKSDTSFNYNNLSFIDNINTIKYPNNITSDYLDIIRDKYCLDISLTPEQQDKYKYRPKLLCYDIYGKQEIYFLILLINDIISTKDFRPVKLKMPKREHMLEICNQIYNSNRRDILKYNNKN